MTPLEDLAELNPDGLEKALVGYTVNHHHPHVAVYDIDKCVDVLAEINCDRGEVTIAVEFDL